MKHCGLLVVLVLALSSLGWSWGTPTFTKTNCAATTCTIGNTTASSHHGLVVGFTSGTVSGTISSVTAGACNVSWVIVANTAISAVGTGSSELAYCTDSVASTSTVVTASVSVSAGFMWDIAQAVGDTVALDAGGTPSGNVNNTGANCTVCTGTSLTLSGNSDFIATAAICGGTCSAITGTGCTFDTNPSGDGIAYCLNIVNSGAYTAPATWTMTSGKMVANALALQETSGVSPCVRTMLGVSDCL